VEPVTREELEELIKEAKAAGKNTEKLEKDLDSLGTAREAPIPQMGQKKEKETDEGTIVIESTGPVKEEDFK